MDKADLKEHWDGFENAATQSDARFILEKHKKNRIGTLDDDQPQRKSMNATYESSLIVLDSEVSFVGMPRNKISPS